MIKKPGIPKRIVITFEYPEEPDPAHREKEFVLEGEDAATVEALIFRKENVPKFLKGHPNHDPDEVCKEMEQGRCMQGEPQEHAVAVVYANKVGKQCSPTAH